MNKKILIAITNRSSYNKVKTVIENLPGDVSPVLLLGHSLFLYRYGYAYSLIKSDWPSLPILRVSMAVDGDELSKMPKSVGMGTIELAVIMENEKPDMVITVADRYETLATAVAASYMNIPLAHIQGGEISGTIDDKVRNAITQLADFHFPATNDAADRIMQMKPKDNQRIWNFGCPSMDILLDSLHCGISELNSHGVGDPFDASKKYIIVMFHPDTKGDPLNESNIKVAMNALNTFKEQKVIFWNNIDPGGDVIAKAWRMSQHGFWLSPVRYIRHLDPSVFGALLARCSCIVGNSSAGIREATFLGVPSVTVGDRQEGRERGINVISMPFCFDGLVKAIGVQLKSAYLHSDLYGDGHAGKKIADKISECI